MFKNKLLFHTSKVRMAIADGKYGQGAPKRWFSWKRGRLSQRGSYHLTITLSLPVRGDASSRTVRSWSWRWKEPVKYDSVMDQWMNNKPGKFRMNNGQTFREFRADRNKARKAEADSYKEIVDDVIQ